MNPCDVLYFLTVTVTVTVTTVTSQPVKFLPVSKDTNLNDLHMLLDVSCSFEIYYCEIYYHRSYSHGFSRGATSIVMISIFEGT